VEGFINFLTFLRKREFDREWGERRAKSRELRAKCGRKKQFTFHPRTNHQFCIHPGLRNSLSACKLARLFQCLTLLMPILSDQNKIGPFEVSLTSKAMNSIGMHKIIKEINATNVSKNRFILANPFYNPSIPRLQIIFSRCRPDTSSTA
jgi:hypothetical protein